MLLKDEVQELCARFDDAGRESFEREMPPDRRHQTNIAISSWTVACIEWYDFSVYGTAAAPVFPAAFFPSNALLVGTLLSFTTFGVGFLARPLRGRVFGHIGDTVFSAFRRNSNCPVSVHLADVVTNLAVGGYASVSRSF